MSLEGTATKAAVSEITCSEKRRARLKKAAKQLSDEDLAMVLLEKTRARKGVYVNCNSKTVLPTYNMHLLAMSIMYILV